MKKSILFLMFFCSLALGSVKSGYYPNVPEIGRPIVFYAEWATDVNSAGVDQPTDFNDANTCVISTISLIRGETIFSYEQEFRGKLYEIEIDPNGSDTSFTVGVYVDPPEPNLTLTVAELYTIDTWTINATSGRVKYFIPALDTSSNVVAGDNIAGKIYIGLKSTTHSTLDNLKVYLYGKLE
ncbi:MAG: hypothetical protein PHQ00_00020 [Phycisphaerae bacterium]|nr:hypothetical protein [Phycisphaerae bacterium]